MRDRYHWGATASGLVLLGMVGQTAFSPVIGYVTNRIGPRWPSAAAFFASGPIFITLGYYTQSNTTPSKVLFCVMVMGIGLCSCLGWIPHLVGINIIAERSGSGQAYALMNVAFAMGLTVGPIWAGAVNARWGWSTLCVSIAVLGIASGAVELLAWRTWKETAEERRHEVSPDEV